MFGEVGEVIGRSSNSNETTTARATRSLATPPKTVETGG
jgi:hypothetical protein